MRRIYHHFSKWEEYAAGLWKRPQHPDVDAALKFMSDVDRWVQAMRKVTQEWPYSCEQNLSHTEHNRVAWLGQAAVCLGANQPSVTTRQAWWLLTDQKQSAANRGAQDTIVEWEARHLCLGSQQELMF